MAVAVLTTLTGLYNSKYVGWNVGCITIKKTEKKIEIYE